jgi:hypothetical protein
MPHAIAVLCPQLTASDEELARRLRLLAAAEGQLLPETKPGASKKAAAAAAAAASARGHNNERDFGRRLEAFRALVQEDANDLAARVRGQ